MASTTVHLHGGPLDGAVRDAATDPEGQPAERVDFDYEADGATWYVQYRRDRHDSRGWHFRATGVEQRADEE